MPGTTTHRSTVAVSASRLRTVLGHFATGVTVVTSVASDGGPVGTTASAVSAVSLDPPLVLVCLERASHTLAAIREHGAFAINVLAEGQQWLSTNFAKRGSMAAWETVTHDWGASGSPRLQGVLAAIECAVEHRVAGGDHEIVVGRVLELDVGADDVPPLVHYRGAYASLAQS